MGRSSQSSIWPFLLVVAFLFLLSIVAPREWEHIAHQEADRPMSSGVKTTADAIEAVAGGETMHPSTSPYDNIDSAPVDDDGRLSETTDNDAASATAIGLQVEPLSVNQFPATEATGDIGIADRVAIHQEAPSVQQRDAEPTSTLSAEEGRTTELNMLRSMEEPQPVASAAATATTDAVEPATDVQGHPVDQAPSHSFATKPRWPLPVDLLRRLDSLGCECECTDWALQTSGLVLQLCEQSSPADQEAQEVFVQLRDACSMVDTLVPNVLDRGVVIELLRVRHALVRRLDVWELVPELLQSKPTPGSLSEGSAARLTTVLDRLETITAQAGSAGKQWHKYLGLDALRVLVRQDSSISLADCKRLASEILLRLEREDLSEVQRQFIASKPVMELADALRPLSLEAIDPMRLLADLERFEDTCQPHDAHQLADDVLQSETLAGAGVAFRAARNQLSQCQHSPGVDREISTTANAGRHDHDRPGARPNPGAADAGR